MRSCVSSPVNSLRVFVKSSYALPEIGRLAVLQDPAGAVFQVMQPFGDVPEPPS